MRIKNWQNEKDERKVQFVTKLFFFCNSCITIVLKRCCRSTLNTDNWVWCYFSNPALNPCREHLCTQLCLLSGMRPRYYSCHCQSGWKLDTDQRTCIEGTWACTHVYIHMYICMSFCILHVCIYVLYTNCCTCAFGKSISTSI